MGIFVIMLKNMIPMNIQELHDNVPFTAAGEQMIAFVFSEDAVDYGHKIPRSGKQRCVI